MSPSAFITVRTVKSGRRYVVRFRLGGRFTALIHAGSFKTRRDAETRRQFVIAELAAGRDPRVSLAAIAAPEVLSTLREHSDAWLKSRVDLRAGSVHTYTFALKALPDWLLDMPTQAITYMTVARAFADMPQTTKTKRLYRATVAQVFDFANVTPNPVRDRRFKLPKLERVEVHPPPAAHVLAILERVPANHRLLLVLLEQTGARVEELTGVPWGDVDMLGNRIRVASRRSKTHRARWLQVPPWLMELVADLCPPEDRSAERRVFTTAPATVRSAMRRACVAAQIPHYHPHDLRHRRVSLWHGQGIPARELADRAGHSATVSLDVYAHVMPLVEITAAEYEEVLR